MKPASPSRSPLRRSKAVAAFSIIALAITLTGFRAEITKETYVGYAYGDDGVKLLYTEEFTDTYQNGTHVETVTKYFDPTGRPIAERVLDFRRSRFAPSYRIEDLRSGYQEGAQLEGDKIRMFVRVSYQSATKEQHVVVPQPAVVDGGFNQFLKANWSRLERGETVPFYFAIPARMDYFSFRASMVSKSSTEMTIRVEPGQPLIRLIAAPIFVRYDLETRRILSYHGQSNIANDKGITFATKLVYPDKGP